ncbi:hypothetical protein [Colwellia sp. TT2012]|uniref:hypothetical protein n=1 Tax=Colwellia sp. TT2012 TaxID=1720342 RepID=UPI000AABC1A6|nr:hypothetical protein [Colwellia sp. TT2012]
MMTQKSDGERKVARREERRKNTDFWIYLQTSLALFSWIFFLVALIMSYYAAPDQYYGILRYYDIEIRQFWLTPLTGYLYILLWLSTLGAYIALMTDKYRCRRYIDNRHYHLMFLIVVNLIWLVYLLVEAP